MLVILLLTHISDDSLFQFKSETRLINLQSSSNNTIIFLHNQLKGSILKSNEHSSPGWSVQLDMYKNPNKIHVQVSVQDL